LRQDEPEPTESELVDFAYYGKAIPSGLERPPRDVDEPRIRTLTDGTARALSEIKTQHLTYDDYLYLWCYAFFNSCADAAISEDLDALSNGPSLSPEQATAVAIIRTGSPTHTTTEEADRTRLGFLPLTKGGPASMDSDRIFADLAHERLCRP
jgi:hypothetical protein